MEEPHSQVGWYSQRRVTEHPRPLFPGFRGPAQGVGAQAPPAPVPAWCRLVLAVGPAALHLQRPREHQPGAWGRPGDRVCVAVSRGIAVQFSPASRPRARSVKGLPGPFHHLHPTAPLAPGTRKRTGPHFRGHQPDGGQMPTRQVCVRRESSQNDRGWGTYRDVEGSYQLPTPSWQPERMPGSSNVPSSPKPVQKGEGWGREGVPGSPASPQGCWPLLRPCWPLRRPGAPCVEDPSVSS